MTSNVNSLFKRLFPAILLILLAGTIIYSNTFEVPYALDDENSIVRNDVIERLDNFYANRSGYDFLPNRYVPYLTFALNYHFGGLDVTGYHVVNLAIHLLTALLVFALLRLTFRTPYCQPQPSVLSPQSSVLSPHFFIPLFGTLLFVTHPVQTQSVTYIVQRVTSMATMFYLLSMVLYVQARLVVENAEFRMQNAEKHSFTAKSRIKPWLLIGGATLSAILAMKSKEISFTLPLAVLLYEVCFFRGPWKRRLLYLLPLLATIPIIPVTVIGFGVSDGSVVSGSAADQLRVGNEISRLDYLFTQFRVIVTYLRLLVLPINQNLDYDYQVYNTFFTVPVFLSFLLLLGIFILGVYLFYISRFKPQSKSESQPALLLISFGIFWFFLTLSVESSVIPIRDVIMEHRLYLPFFGAAAVFAAIFYLLIEKLTGPSSGRLLFLGAAILVLVLGLITYQRNYVWGNAIRLWQDVAAKSPNKARPINNLGQALEEAGRRPEAFKALSRAIAIDPNYYKSYYNLADLYLVTGQPEAALPLLQTAIRLNPNFTEAYVSFAAALMRSGKFREVTAFLEQNLDRVGYIAEARFYLGASYAFLGNREAALKELAIISRSDPALAATLAGMLGLKPGPGMSHGRQ